MRLLLTLSPAYDTLTKSYVVKDHESTLWHESRVAIQTWDPSRSGVDLTPIFLSGSLVYSKSVSTPGTVPTDRDLLCLARAVYSPDTSKLEGCLWGLSYQLYALERGPTSGLTLALGVPLWMARRGCSTSQRQVEGKVPLVFVISGTDPNLIAHCKEDVKLAFDRFTSSDCPSELVTETANVVRDLVMEVLGYQPWLEGDVEVVLSGHSLGAHAVACATVLLDAMVLPWQVRCVAFESPGLPPPIMNLARRRPPAYWENILTTYLASPTPINTLHPHLGRIYHIQIPFAPTWSHAAKCLVADMSRIAGWCSLLKGAVTARGALAPLLTSLSSASRYFCTALGVEVEELLEQHYLENMLPCFDFASGGPRPEYCCAMASWPVMGNFREELGSVVLRGMQSLVPSFVPGFERNVGVYNIRSRNDMILRRLKELPGYVPANQED